MARRRRYDSGSYESSRSGSRRYTARRRERRSEERQVEMVSFGAIIVIFAITLLFPGKFSPAWISVIGGGILVASGVYQSQRHWRVNPMTWIGGILLLLAGILALSGSSPLPGGILLPIGIFAAVIIASAITGEF
ncbi:MAG: hypothetical protein ABI947_16170 [Chloroflexota bacterium]